MKTATPPPQSTAIPAQAGIQRHTWHGNHRHTADHCGTWTPACAGVTAPEAAAVVIWQASA